MNSELSEDQLRILFHLVAKEMSGICGDVEYLELSKIKKYLVEELESKTTND
ncbi:hypothetical protein AB4254_11550 [Vibrio breoganii]